MNNNSELKLKVKNTINVIKDISSNDNILYLPPKKNLNDIIPEPNENQCEKCINKYIDKNINTSDLVEYYTLIKIDANNTTKDKTPQESKYILDNYDYNLALEYEKRNFGRIFYIILLSKDEVLNTFLFKSPLHLKYLRICLLLLSLGNDCGLNAILYFNSKISDQFNYICDNNFWQIIYNNLYITILCTIINKIAYFLLKNMTTSKCCIERLFRNEEKKMRKDENYKVNNKTKKEIKCKLKAIFYLFKVKIFLFFLIEIILLLFYCYFMIAFCEVYKKTQINILKDAVFSFIISYPISIGISLILCILYKQSLKYKKEKLYKFTLFLV